MFFRVIALTLRVFGLTKTADTVLEQKWTWSSLFRPSSISSQSKIGAQDDPSLLMSDSSQDQKEEELNSNEATLFEQMGWDLQVSEPSPEIFVYRDNHSSLSPPQPDQKQDQTIVPLSREEEFSIHTSQIPSLPSSKQESNIGSKHEHIDEALKQAKQVLEVYRKKKEAQSLSEDSSPTDPSTSSPSQQPTFNIPPKSLTSQKIHGLKQTQVEQKKRAKRRKKRKRKKDLDSNQTHTSKSTRKKRDVKQAQADALQRMADRQRKQDLNELDPYQSKVTEGTTFDPRTPAPPFPFPRPPLRNIEQWSELLPEPSIITQPLVTYAQSSRALELGGWLWSLEDLLSIHKVSQEQRDAFFERFAQHLEQQKVTKTEIDGWWINLNRVDHYLNEYLLERRSELRPELFDTYLDEYGVHDSSLLDPILQDRLAPAELTQLEEIPNLFDDALHLNTEENNDSPLTEDLSFVNEEIDLVASSSQTMNETKSLSVPSFIPASRHYTTTSQSIMWSLDPSLSSSFDSHSLSIKHPSQVEPSQNQSNSIVLFPTHASLDGNLNKSYIGSLDQSLNGSLDPSLNKSLDSSLNESLDSSLNESPDPSLNLSDDSPSILEPQRKITPPKSLTLSQTN